MPRSLRRRAAVALVGAALVSLAACATAPPLPTPAPTPDASEPPIFASDEEALAAAVEAYEAYSAASGAIGLDGGIDTERVRDLVTPELYDQIAEEFEALHEAKLRIDGTPRIYGPKLAGFAPNSTPTVSVYFCRDITMTRVIRADGSDATPADRQAVQAVLAHFQAAGPKLLVSEIDRWSDDSLC